MTTPHDRLAEERKAATTEALLAEFRSLAAWIEKSQSAWTIYLKCNTMRFIWHELESRGVKPIWPGDPT